MWTCKMNLIEKCKNKKVKKNLRRTETIVSMNMYRYNNIMWDLIQRYQAVEWKVYVLKYIYIYFFFLCKSQKRQFNSNFRIAFCNKKVGFLQPPNYCRVLYYIIYYIVEYFGNSYTITISYKSGCFIYTKNSL